MWRTLSICHPPQKVLSHKSAVVTVDIPFEPADFEPVDWELFGAMKQDVSGYFVKTDENGLSEMDKFVMTQMDFGEDEELPIGPPPPVKKSVAPAKTAKVPAKTWAPTKPKSTPVTRTQAPPRKTSVKAARPLASSTRGNIPRPLPKERFVREDMVDEVKALEQEEMALLKDDDSGMAFDLEL